MGGESGGIQERSVWYGDASSIRKKDGGNGKKKKKKYIYIYIYIYTEQKER